jgi:hypothetical protein
MNFPWSIFHFLFKSPITDLMAQNWEENIRQKIDNIVEEKYFKES